MKILLLHGIHHSMSSKRGPAQCRALTPAEMNASLTALGGQPGAEIKAFQTSGSPALHVGVSAAQAGKGSAS